MSSPSSSSSATAGRRRWTRLRRPRRSTLIDWGAAALTAAALYLTPALLLGVLVGSGWTVAALVVCLAVLVVYSMRFGSPLGVLITLVLIAAVELVVRFGTAAADTCGTSRAASAVEWSGAAVILLGAGTWSTHRRRVAPLLAALVAAGIWYGIVAHLIPGGAGGCFE